jgi:hypothetical protein
MTRNREKLLKMDDERKGRGEGERKEGGGGGKDWGREERGGGGTRATAPPPPRLRARETRKHTDIPV